MHHSPGIAGDPQTGWVGAGPHLGDVRGGSGVRGQRRGRGEQGPGREGKAGADELVDARDALVLALVELVGHRDAQTGAHLRRMGRYCRCLAEEAARSRHFAGRVDVGFIERLEGCAALHDIGKACVPDRVLLKRGPLTPRERKVMQTHTTIGAAVLEAVTRRHGFARGFLEMAAGVARHHHERYDGRGYPDGLAGEAIPLAARVVAFADVYDALRSRRPYKRALAHRTAVRLMTRECQGQFDPALMEVFRRCEDSFKGISCERAG